MSKQGDAYKEQVCTSSLDIASERNKKAIDVHGPQPVYNTNIAAAYLKLHMCVQVVRLLCKLIGA